jgi:long-subunit fatty acid transport protein
MLVFLFVSVSASGEQKFEGVEVDTTEYFTIQNYLLSPFQLTDYNFLGGGAKARGMGGAFFAVSDDPTAASWNPAGLTQLDKAQMNLSFSSYMGRTEYTTTLASPDDFEYSFGDELKYDENAISFASVAIPFTLRDRELVGGVFYQRLMDISQENKYAMLLDSVVYMDTTVKNYVLPPIDEKMTGKLDVVSLSLGGKLFESLSLGAGVNIYAGDFTSDVNFFASADPTGLNGIRFHPHIKGDYSGFNFTMGAMYELNKLRLAGVVKTPFTLKEENDVKLFQDIIELGVVLETSSSLASPFFETDRKWKMPTMIGFGTSYQINSLTLAADVEFRNYSKTEVTYRRNIANPSDEEVTTGDYLTDKWWGSEGNEPPFVPSLEWRDLTQFRLGAEYIINTEFGSIPIRVGFRNDPQLFKTQLDSSQVYLRMDMYVSGRDTGYQAAFVQSDHGVESGSWVNGNVFTLGTGIGWSQIKFDVTYEYASYDDVNKDISTGLISFDRGNKVLLEPLDTNNFTKKESNKYSRITISFTGFF